VYRGRLGESIAPIAHASEFRSGRER
jgi:hypothetical protein